MPNTTDEQQPPSGPLPPATVAALLETATRARRSGNIPAARALLRALSLQQPDSSQVWLALALVAETRIEQRRALERVIALDPANSLAQRGLARIGAVDTTAPPPQPAGGRVTRRLDDQAPEGEATIAAARDEAGARPAAALTPTAPSPEERAQALRWPLYAIIVASLIVVLVAALLLRPEWFARSASSPEPTPALGAGAPTAAPASAAPTIAASAAPAATAAAQPTLAPQPSATPGPTATPEPTMPPGLPPGEIVTQGQWHAILIRPDYAMLLEGSIGALQPRGRFLLALVAVGNDGAAPARIPSDLFAVVDREGNRYAPLPAASTAYLDSYGRGQRGDLSMEDAIPPDGGNKSVPLIFDIPQGARDLSLVVKGAPKGWAISGS
ncbi:MAG: hypothetical protein IPO81_06255 [Kouleothrix sp.]|nr:hypothetical protein [Kouleothrix sp.]